MGTVVTNSPDAGNASHVYRVVNDLTGEVLGIFDSYVPEIITSSSLPPFSAASTGSDWGRILGIDPKYNEQIDFGLNRPRPTEADVRKALGWAPDLEYSVHPSGAILAMEELNPIFSDMGG